MSIKKITVSVDENLYNIHDEPVLSVKVEKNGEVLSHRTFPRDFDAAEISDEYDYTAREILKDKTLSPKDRRDKYELYMEAASKVPGLRK